MVINLGRIAHSLPGAQDIVEVLAKRDTKLSHGWAPHDLTGPNGKLLFNVLVMADEFESDLYLRTNKRRHANRQG